MESSLNYISAITKKPGSIDIRCSWIWCQYLCLFFFYLTIFILTDQNAFDFTGPLVDGLSLVVSVCFSSIFQCSLITLIILFLYVESMSGFANVLFFWDVKISFVIFCSSSFILFLVLWIEITTLRLPGRLLCHWPKFQTLVLEVLNFKLCMTHWELIFVTVVR